MVFILFNAIALVLYFDGSLRVPHDPNPQIVPHSTSCQFLPPMASCAGALLLDDNSDDDEKEGVDVHKRLGRRNEVIAIKGKIIDDVILTSANVEYEGLLLALKLLFNFLDENKTSNLYTISDKVVTIRGDCKTVIDQLNDVSKPRKQRDYYDRAICLVENIITNFNITISFEHVLRDQNQLCDSVCHDVIQKHQNEFIGTLDRVIEDIISKEPIMKLPSSKKKRLNCKDTHFSNLINDLSDWDLKSRSRIPLSIRPYWLCKIALHAEQIDDYVAMRLVGEALIKSSKQWKKQGLLHRNKCFVLQMENLGRCMIIYSLEKMELHKEALKLSSKKSRNEVCNHQQSLCDQLRSFQSELFL